MLNQINPVYVGETNSNRLLLFAVPSALICCAAGGVSFAK